MIETLSDTTTGYAVVSFGKIDVATVSPTRRGAVVNWLVTVGRQRIYNHTTDEQIEATWLGLCGRDNRVCEVSISVQEKRVV